MVDYNSLVGNYLQY